MTSAKVITAGIAVAILLFGSLTVLAVADFNDVKEEEDGGDAPFVSIDMNTVTGQVCDGAYFDRENLTLYLEDSTFSGVECTYEYYYAYEDPLIINISGKVIIDDDNQDALASLCLVGMPVIINGTGSLEIRTSTCGIYSWGYIQLADGYLKIQNIDVTILKNANPIKDTVGIETEMDVDLIIDNANIEIKDMYYRGIYTHSELTLVNGGFISVSTNFQGEYYAVEASGGITSAKPTGEQVLFYGIDWLKHWELREWNDGVKRISCVGFVTLAAEA